MPVKVYLREVEHNLVLQVIRWRVEKTVTNAISRYQGDDLIEVAKPLFDDISDDREIDRLVSVQVMAALRYRSRIGVKSKNCSGRVPIQDAEIHVTLTCCWTSAESMCKLLRPVSRLRACVTIAALNSRPTEQAPASAPWFAQRLLPCFSAPSSMKARKLLVTTPGDFR